MNLSQTKNALKDLLVYRSISHHHFMKLFKKLLSHKDGHTKKAEQLYFDLFHELACEQYRLELQGNLWQNFTARLIWQEENFYTRIAEKQQPQFESLSSWIQHDLPLLKEILFFDWKQFASDYHFPKLPCEELETVPFSATNLMQKGISELITLFREEKTPQSLHQKLNAFYQEYGCGTFAGHLAFQWENGLRPVIHPQFVYFKDLVGYEYQKSILLKNTRSFVQGKKANHVLLYGEKGTGKSSSVKALLPEFASQGLRIVEITRQQFKDFPAIMESMKNRRFRFILFVDDLSFEASDHDFKYIKSCIEGSLENSENVLIYATSNRRHLIRENWSDRESNDTEVHISDTHQEKLSLADRFGITLSYYSPDKEQYLEIVKTLARQEKLEIPEDILREQAMQWEKMYHGYSGRSARQFVNSLAGESKK